MNNALVTGSLSAISKQSGKGLAETFLSVDAVILVDTSGSMGARDAVDRTSRHDAAEAELRRLQEALPGKIAVVSFSSDAVFCPSGIPTRLNGGTDMAKALRFVKPADNCGIRIFLLSDGAPDDERAVLAEAAKFKSRIDCIFIGPERDFGGRQFLDRLAKATGGKSLKSSDVAKFEQEVYGLLTA